MSPNKNKRVTSREDSPDPEERRSKRRKYSDDEEDYGKDEDSKAPSTSKKTPLSSHSTHNKPAELFRKDLISAMKMADSEQLNEEDYILIADQWRQDWERGVQVPVNKEGILLVEMRPVIDKYSLPGDFKIPKKYLHDARDETYKQGIHELTGMQQLAEQVVRYDLDDLDVCWLQKVNEEREEMGEVLIHEWTMERLIETFENDCHETMEMKKKTEEGLGIEYDEDVVCEVCRSPDSEENNEMVFCDGCDICVHQACYGIQKVPEGSWLCRICALGIKPTCILCPKTGGAMKSTRSGTKWAHVSCAIWIPEVSIACVEKMEPVTKISQVPGRLLLSPLQIEGEKPQEYVRVRDLGRNFRALFGFGTAVSETLLQASRWALICTICKERTGACIQCSVKSCKTAFHVSCAIQDNLEMKTILVEEEEDPDDAVKLKAYCPKHCKKRERNSSESETDSPRKSNSGTPRKDMTEEEIDHLRKEKLKQLKEEFYKCVDRAKVADTLTLDPEIVDLVFIYWKLKRKTNFDQPLLTPRTQEAEILEKQQEDSLVARMKMFVRLRQDLERVRNLCYMVSRREKIKRSYNRVRENIFYSALNVLMDKKYNFSAREIEKIIRKFSPPTHKETLFPAASKKSPSTVQTETENIISSGASSGVLMQGTSQSGSLSYIKHKRKERQKLNFDSVLIKKDIVTNDVTIDVKEELISAEIGTMTEDDVDVSKGRDQTNVTSEGNSQNSYFKDLTIDSEKKSASSNLEGPVKPTRGRPPKSRLKLRHKLNRPIQEDLHEIIPLNVNNNSVIASGMISTSEGETQTPVDDSMDEESTRMSLRTRAKRESDLSPAESENANRETRNNYSIVIKKELKEILADEKDQTPDVRETYLASKNRDKNERVFLSTRRKGQSSRKDRQALLQGQESLKKYFTPVERNSSDEVEIKMEKNVKEEDKTMVPVQEMRSSVVSEDSALEIIKSETNEECKNAILLRQTRRSVPLRNSKSLVFPRGRVQEKHLVRDKFIDSLPSSKNVSEHIKNELNGYLRNNKLIVSNELREKVQIHLLRKQKQNHVLNGFHDKSQTRLDLLFSPPRTLTDSRSSDLSSPDFRNSFRVLNELSPMRDGDGNVNRRTGNSPGLRCQSLLSDKKNVHESITTRSVSRKIDRDFDSHIIDGVVERKHFTTNHETSPTSTNSLHSSGRGFSGSKVEAEKLLLRSLSPTQSAKSYDESDLIDLENLYEEEFPRRTRSQCLDEDRSQSPRNSLR